MLESTEIPFCISGKFQRNGYEDTDKNRLNNMPLDRVTQKYTNKLPWCGKSNSLGTHYQEIKRLQITHSLSSNALKGYTALDKTFQSGQRST